MSANPFQADTSIRLRCEEMTRSIGPDLERDIAGMLASHPGSPRSGRVLSPDQCATLMAKYALKDISELMRLAQPAARQYAVPPISDFYVGAVGLDDSGSLIFGGNMEFPFTHLGLTIHGETFLAARAFSRGFALRQIALGEAHPCGHCRQFLSESSAAASLRIIDPLGHDLGLSDLLPWPFDPAYLNDPGCVAGRINWPDLRLSQAGPLFNRLVETGQLAHAPYSKNPAAVICVMTDGEMISGAALESVAFNPSMGPMQTAIINLTAFDYKGIEIAEIHIAERAAMPVNHTAQTMLLAAQFAPQARVNAYHWRA